MTVRAVDPAYFIMSRSALPEAPSRILPRTCLLRNSPKVTYTYTNEAGEVVREYTFERARKSLFNYQRQQRSSPLKARRATTRFSTASTRTARSCPRAATS